MRHDRTRLAVCMIAAVVGGAIAAPAMGSAQSPFSSETERGSWVLFQWYQPGKDTTDLFLSRQDGSDRQVLLGDLPGERRAADWSPDGTRIAFVTRDDATPDGSIWLVDADGSDARQLFDPATDCPWGAFHPAWSPDGQRLAIVCYPGDEGVSTLAIVDLATLELTTIASVTWPESLDTAASWSPDGSTLVFGILHWDPTNTFIDGSLLATVPVVGGDRPTRLGEFDSFDASPDWHPTQDLITFNTYELGSIRVTNKPSNIFTIRSDGSERRQLTTISTSGTLRIGQPRWMPDGKGLAAALAHGGPAPFVEVVAVDAATGEVTLPTTTIDGSHPDVRPMP